VRDQECPTTTLTVRPSKYQAEVASLGPPATVEGANTLYMYGVDLIWVWSGWDASIITYSILQVVDSLTAVTVTVIVKPNQVGVASLWPLTAVGGAEVLKLNTYMSDVVLIENDNDKWLLNEENETNKITITIQSKDTLIWVPTSYKVCHFI
jgi:hypothetical protein